MPIEVGLLFSQLGSQRFKFKFSIFEVEGAIRQFLRAINKLTFDIFLLELLHLCAFGGILVLKVFVVVTNRLEDFVLVLLSLAELLDFL